MMSDCEKNGDLQELEINLTVILDIFYFRHIDFADGERRLVEPGRKPRRQVLAQRDFFRVSGFDNPS